jgi:hypothetical protein
MEEKNVTKAGTKRIFKNHSRKQQRRPRKRVEQQPAKYESKAILMLPPTLDIIRVKVYESNFGHSVDIRRYFVNPDDNSEEVYLPGKGVRFPIKLIDEIMNELNKIKETYGDFNSN